MPIDYKKILKQAYQIVREHKGLWLLGLFLIWGGFTNFNFGVPNFQNNSPEEVKVRNFLNDQFISHPILVILALLLVLFLIYMYFRPKAALILGVKQITEKKFVRLGLTFAQARPFFWRLIFVSIAVVLMISILTAILGFPIFALFRQHLIQRAWTLVLLALIIYIPIGFIIFQIGLFAPMFVILHNLNIGPSLRAALDFATKLWRSLLVFNIILGIIQPLATFGAGLLAAVFMIPFFALGFKNPLFFGLGLPLASIVFLGLLAFIASFSQTALTLFFLEVVKPIKKEEGLESEPLPEIAN